MKQNILNDTVKIKTKENEFLKSIFLVLSGVIFLSIMSQLIIPLYFTPVPISLGSFGVILIALLYGRKLGTATVLSYVVAGSLGAPVFAGFKAGSLFSPTGGYILGYIAAALILGFLSDKGIAKSYVKTFLSLLLASAVILVLGALVLILFVPSKNIFMIGVLPFIPGDMLKIVAATLLFPRLWKFIKTNKN
jgi:bioY protein